MDAIYKQYTKSITFSINMDWIQRESYKKAYAIYLKRENMIKTIRRPRDGPVHYVLSQSQTVYKQLTTTLIDKYFANTATICNNMLPVCDNICPNSSCTGMKHFEPATGRLE